MKPKSRFHCRRPAHMLAITLVLSHLPQVHAANGTWTHDGYNYNYNWNSWDLETNWSDGIVANGVDSTANLITPNSTDYQVIELNSPRTIGNITFGHLKPFASSTWGIDQLNPTNILTLAVSAGSPVITVNENTYANIGVGIAGVSGLTKEGSGSLDLYGQNTYSGTTTILEGHLGVSGAGTLGNGTAGLTLDGGFLYLGGTTQTVGAVIINGADSGISGGNLVGTSYSVMNGDDYTQSITAGLGGVGGTFEKTGVGALVLSGDNTFTGATTIGAGFLQYEQKSSLYNGDESKWTKENLSVSSGATLAISVGGTGGFSAQQAQTLLGAITTDINDNGLRAGATFAVDIINSVGTTTFDQAITDSSGSGSGALGFTKLGWGTLLLNQINTHTGPTTITGGTLAIGGAGTLGHNSDLIIDNGSNYNNPGRMDLGGTTQTVASVILKEGSIENGSLIASSYSVTGQGVISASLGGAGADVTVGSFPASLTLSGLNTYSGTTTINGGSLFVTGSGTLGSQSALVVNSGKLDLGGTSQSVGSVAVNAAESTFTSIENGSLNATSYSINITKGQTVYEQRVPMVVSAGLGGLDASLAKTGTGAAHLSGVNTYTGTTTISAGRVLFEKTASLYNGDESKWSKANLSVGSGGTLAISVGGSGGFTMQQAKDMVGTLATGIDNNGLQAGSAFGVSVGSGTQTFDQVIADSTGTGGGALGFTKLGGGNLVLNQVNTHTGPTTISGGTLTISGTGNLGNNAALHLSSFGKLDLGGTTQTVAAVDTTQALFSSMRNGSLIASSYSMSSGVISANLGGTGASFNVSSGAALLSGINTYTGPTMVSEDSSLYLQKAASLYNGDVAQWTKEKITVAAGATLSVDVGGTGEFSLGEAKTLLGNLTTSTNNNGLKAGSIFGISTNSADGDTTFDQVIQNSTGIGGGALGLTKSGGGRLILNQANTYSGPTTIEGGALAISGSGKLGINSALEIRNDGILDLGGTTQSVGAVNVGVGGRVENGGLIASSYNVDGGVFAVNLGGVGADFTSSGETTLSGVNTYTGTTTFYGGLFLKTAASLYNGDTTKWTASNISANGMLAINVGGAGEFSIGQAKTLLSNLTTSLNSSGGLGYGTFGIDTTNATGDTTFNQVISDSTGLYGGEVSISKLGSGNLILDRSNTYTGATTVSSGTLVVNGSISASILTTVESGATLGGSGSVGSLRAETGGTVAPGTSIGSLQSGSVTFANNSTYQYEVDSSAVLAAGADLLVIQGDLNLDMTQLAFGNIAAAPESFQVGTLFTLLNYTGSWNGGLFVLGSNILEDGELFFAGQNFWSIDYDAAIGGLNFSEDQFVSSSSRFINITATAVPEPSSILLGAAASLLLLRRRR